MAAQMAVNSAASLWGPFKELWDTVINAIWGRQPEAVHLLDLILKKHKPDFISLFKNPSSEQKEKVRKASTDGISVQGHQGTRLLPEQLLSEAFILSDLFNIGELAALELLLAGEHQQPHFPGLTRGLVAVLLYWDGKRCIANSLRSLIQSRRGKTFTLELSAELVSITTRFTDDLMNQGLTRKILTLVSEISVTAEFEKLQKARGLGNEKHRKENNACVPLSALVEFTEGDEALADAAITHNAFLFLTEAMLGSEGFGQEEFYTRRIHSLLTDFLALMPMKVKQLRNRAEEDARLVHMSMQMGSEPPAALRRDLEQLMILIGAFYGKDPFNLELALEYWCPSESVHHSSTITGSYLGVTHQRPPHKQVVLSKFVRQMGDLLPSTLYIPYLSMLKGLANGPQCAHYCFSLLKVNGAPHENIQASGGSPVSWEHFFHSLMLYHESLRRDMPSVDISQYRHPSLRGITQREQDGLVSFLQLTTTIIKWSENARLALCEHPQWTPVVVMLGLLQCSIPPVLKSELLESLSAFGKSPEIASSLWQSLEYTQILQTVRAPGQRQAAGIEVELNEIESRCEEYPLTRSFCHLISTLVESSFPTNLGAGLRPPGFEPYLQFLRDAVFLPFPTRAYRRAEEKWEVAEAVLDVFHKLLKDYEPQPSDFVEEMVELQGELVVANKSPGYSVMFHLLNDSPMFTLCLSLLEEGVKQLDTYAPFPGKKHLERAVQLCLSLLDLTLQKETLFMDLLRESQSSVIVTPLEQLLQGVSAQSKKADHVVNIARYLYHGNSNPEVAFESANILRCIARYPNIQARLVGDFTHDQSVSEKLMAGFVECLDNEDAEELGHEGDDSDPEKRLARIRHETRVHILNLLITSLELKHPNLALYLLGYEVKKPVSTTNLQDPGVLGCPRSCLHAILSLLEKGAHSRSGPVLMREAPQLAELCYQVIYQLCACSDTSGPTMRYLRTSQDFLFSQLQHLPFNIQGHEISALNQMSWLMKTAAIELRLTSLNRQRSHTQRLLHLLLDDQPHGAYTGTAHCPAHRQPHGAYTGTAHCPAHRQPHGAYTGTAHCPAHRQPHGAYTGTAHCPAHRQLHGAYTGTAHCPAHRQLHGAYTGTAHCPAHRDSPTERTLVQHIALHTGSSTELTLVQHIALHTGSSTERTLVQHIALHTGSPTERTLVQHIALHTGSSTERTLVQHIALHTGNSTEHTLVQHIALYTGSSTERTLVQHIALHTETAQRSVHWYSTLPCTQAAPWSVHWHSTLACTQAAPRSVQWYSTLPCTQAAPRSVQACTQAAPRSVQWYSTLPCTQAAPRSVHWYSTLPCTQRQPHGAYTGTAHCPAHRQLHGAYTGTAHCPAHRQLHGAYTGEGETGAEDETRSVSGFLHFDTVSKVRRKILSVLDSIDFSQEVPDLPQLDFFDRAQIEQVISNCEHSTEHGQTVCNIKEVNSILQHVVERNRMRQSLSAKRHTLQSWRNLVETVLTACPQDLIPTEDRQLIIRDLLLDLHDKVLSEDAAADLMPVVAGAVFTLTAHLSQSVRTEQQQGVRTEGITTSGFASITNSALHLILRKLLDFILCTGGGFQRLRAHLYGALLYYLQVAQKPDEPETLETADKSMWERLTAPEDAFTKLQRENLAIIESYGTALMEVVCRDACDGHEIGRMLALAVLDRIVSIDKQCHWLLYMSNSGYLRVLVESLRQEDLALQSLLSPQPPLLKALYIYESKMALLMRVAKNPQGAAEILRCGLIVQLVECEVYDMRPETDSHGVFGQRDPSGFIPNPLDRYRQILLPALRLCQVILTSSTAQHQQAAAQRDPSGFIPNPLDRYRQILLPALRLCQVILTSSTAQHQQAAAQVLQFLIVHSDTIHSILRCQEVTAGSLQELSLLTGIISKAALPGVPHSCVPGMGLIIYLLKQTSADFFRFYESHRQSVSKMQGVEHLPPDEVKELCQSLVSLSSGVDKISTSQRYILAKRRLVKIINNRAKLLSLCSYIIETCLFVLWRHLEYYMLHCTPVDTQDSLLSVRPSFRSRRPEDSFGVFPATDVRSSGLSRVSQQDLDQLQNDMACSFGESLQKKLLDVEGLYCQVRSRYTFIQALVRRIRGLLRNSKS
ncbi:UNVERIFIED_CONTAM: hypothetical protein FKN15_028574 [Acipenser sinensis]